MQRIRALAKSHESVVVCFVLLLLAFIFMSAGLIPGRVAAPSDQLLGFVPWQAHYPGVQTPRPWGDAILQQLPWHQWIQDEWQAGRFPLWAPGPLGGYNLFASYQPGVLYPLHLIWALLPTGVGYGTIMALKLWLAGAGMWLFLRSLGLHYSSSLLGAIGFMFSAGMVSWLSWPHSGVFLLLPWFAWAAYVWCTHRKPGALVGLATLVAIGIFGGHPETLLLVGITAGIWALALLVTSPRTDWGRQVAGLALASIVGVAIGAVQLLPFLEALTLSQETAVRQVGGGTAGLHLDAGSILLWVLPRTWGQLADGVIGGNDGFIGANAYVGLVAPIGLLFTFVAFVRREVSFRLTVPWVVLALWGWLLAYDVSIGGILRGLPLFNRNVNGRAVLIVAFCLLVVGAFGWDWFARKVEERARWSGRQALGTPGVAGICSLAAGVIVLVVHLAGLVPYPDTGEKPGTLVAPTNEYVWYWAIWASGVVFGIAGATLVWSSNWRGRALMPFVMAALLVVDLWMLLITFNPTAPASQYYPTTSFIDQLQVVPPAERILVEGEVLPADTGLIYGFRDWRDQDPMISQRAYQAAHFIDPAYSANVWDDYNMFMSEPRLYVATALGMRYFILPKDHNPNYPVEEGSGQPNFKRLAYKDGLGLWEAQGVPGYAYLSDNVWTVPDEAGAAHWMQNVNWAKMREYAAEVEGPASLTTGIDHTAHIPGSGQPGSVTVTGYSPGHVQLDIDASRPSLLVVAESYYPGWRAIIDDRQAEILQANYLSQGLVMPQGKHTVELTYEPASFSNGVLVTLVGLCGLFGLGAWVLREKRLKKQP